MRGVQKPGHFFGRFPFDAHLQAMHSEADITTDEERLALLQDSLKCGTNCGSCIPELKRNVRAARPAPQASFGALQRKVIPIKTIA